jgi:hypothetical protein
MLIYDDATTAAHAMSPEVAAALAITNERLAAMLRAQLSRGNVRDWLDIHHQNGTLCRSGTKHGSDPYRYYDPQLRYDDGP